MCETSCQKYSLKGEDVYCFLFLKERPLCSISFYILWRVVVPQLESCPCGENTLNAVKINLGLITQSISKTVVLQLNYRNPAVSRIVFKIMHNGDWCGIDPLVNLVLTSQITPDIFKNVYRKHCPLSSELILILKAKVNRVETHQQLPVMIR